MDSQTYLTASERTLSPNYHAERIKLHAFLNMVQRLQELGTEVDQVKRVLYYGVVPMGVDVIAEMESAQDGPAPTLAGIEGLDPNLLHAALGLITESIEFLDVIMRATVDSVHLLEEVGDLEWYLAIAYRWLARLPEDARKVNIAKLQKRFPGKFTDFHAVNRDLLTERLALETIDQP